MFSLHQRAQEFAQTLGYDLEHLSRSTKTVGIQAPTGVGKTTVMLDMFRDQPGTLMILPTQLACQQWMDKKKSGDCILMMNASRALETLLRRRGLHGYKNIIMDEAHVDSKEYYAIRRIMQQVRRKDQRFFFVSATLPVSLLQEEFPDLHRLTYDDFRPHVIDIRYVPSASVNGYHIDRSHLLSVGAQRLVDVMASKKVLVFQPTHDDCDDFAKRVHTMRNKNVLPSTSIMGSCPVLVLHGGLEPEEKETIKKQLATKPAYLVIATNIAESSITLPDLEVIIDSGLECRCQGTYTTVVRASKMSLIQRAGRVGRTRDGVVYRLMPPSLFEALDDFSEQPHSLDSVAVSCLLYGTDALRLFGEGEMTYTLHFLSSVGVGSTTPRPKLEFLQSSRMGMLSASLVWNLVHSCSDRREGMWITLLLVIWEQYDKKSLHWVYHPRKATEKEQWALSQLRNFRRRVCYEKDMLVSIARMLLTILAYGREWRTVAGMLSLNQKNIREFIVDWNRTYSLVASTWKEVPSKNPPKPLEALMQCLGIPEAILPEKTHFSWEVMPVCLDPLLVYKGRCFFMRQPILYGPKMMQDVYYGDLWEEEGDDDNGSVYGHQEWRVDASVYRSPAVPESFRRFPKAIHPLRLRNNSLGNVVVWTNLPHDLEERHEQIMDHVEAYQKLLEKKQIVRAFHKDIRQELNETVALMPPSDNLELDSECRFSGGYLWQQAEEDFRKYVVKRP